MCQSLWWCYNIVLLKLETLVFKIFFHNEQIQFLRSEFQKMVFLVVMYGCESWTMKKAECWRIDAFELWCWRRLLRVPWTARRSNQSILKEISPGISLEGLMLKLKLQYFGQPAKSWLIGKDSDAGRDWGQEGKGTTEDEMAGWHHWLDGHESQWTLGVGDRQGGLACCDSWGCRVGHDWATELNWSKNTLIKYLANSSYSIDMNRLLVTGYLTYTKNFCTLSNNRYIKVSNTMLEKEMATHSSVLAWRIPGTGEPGGLPSMGSHRVGHDWSDLAAAAATLFICVFKIKLTVLPLVQIFPYLVS